MENRESRRSANVDFKLYLISDRRLRPESDLIDLLRQACRAGVKAIQLREKDLTARELYDLARNARSLCSPGNTKLFINDRVDVARAVGADGVQLSRRSLPCAAARTVLGPDALVGASTHSVREIETAEREGCDFALFGPVFPTPSKQKYGAPQGLRRLEAAATATSLPVFAVGGIEPERARSCLDAGAHGVAVIRSVLLAERPGEAAHRFAEALRGL